MYPDKKVAMAIMQAYLQSKENGWINWLKGWQLSYDETNKQIHPPKPESVAGKKFSVCVNILKQISEARDLDTSWVQILQAAHTAAENERKEAWTTSSVGLAETLDALRDYILSELMELDAFKQKRQGLFDDQTRLKLDIDTREKNLHQYDKKELDALHKQHEEKLKETQPLLSLDDTKNREAFFNNWILKQNAVSRELGEKSFNDFVKNVKENKHTLELCDAALNSAKLATATTEDKNNTSTNKNAATPRLSEMKGTLLARPKAKSNRNRTRRGPDTASDHNYNTRSRGDAEYKSPRRK